MKQYDQSTVKPDRKPDITALVTATFLFVGLWWVISKGAAESWLIGIPVVVGAVWASRRLAPGTGKRISLLGLLHFIPFFFWESLRGGLDVALRTLAPRMRIQPAFQHYRMSLKQPAARSFFTACVSLLPGTLAADLQEERLEVHVLNAGADVNTELNKLERAVARLFQDQGVITG
jgi:multicomponent Na+:H+ antiporter subunit E